MYPAIHIDPNPIPFLLQFPYKGGSFFFTLDQIIRLEADSNYTKIYLTDRRPVLMARVLGKYDHWLRPFGFIRTHRSHLVNTIHVKEIDKSGYIRMEDESHVEISRRKKSDVLQLFSHLPQSA